jgi:hypothetical protein
VNASVFTVKIDSKYGLLQRAMWHVQLPASARTSENRDLFPQVGLDIARVAHAKQNSELSNENGKSKDSRQPL